MEQPKAINNPMLVGAMELLKEGKKVYTLECFIKEIEYCGRKEDSPMPYDGQGFMNIPDDLDEELPFR